MEKFQNFPSVFHFGTGIPHARRTGFDTTALGSGPLFSKTWTQGRSSGLGAGQVAPWVLLSHVQLLSLLKCFGLL